MKSGTTAAELVAVEQGCWHALPLRNTPAVVNASEIGRHISVAFSRYLSKNVIRTAKKLKLEGYDVIPHLPARTIENKNDLEKYIGELANESGCSKMLIIGGGGNQAGEISSSIDVLKTDFLSKYNYQFVGVAGHPEGSPDISYENLDLAIKQKNDFA